MISARALPRQICVGLLALALVGGEAAAEGLRVGAGEHGDYSRLVFPGLAGAGFRLEPRPRGARLVGPVDAAPEGFDAYRVVEQRRAHRVSGFRQRRAGGEWRIDIDLTCACSVRLFDGANGLLIFDVAPGGPSDVATGPDASGETPQAARARDALEEAAAALRAMEAAAPEEPFGADIETATTPEGGAEADVAALPEPPADPGLVEDADMFRALFLEQLERAQEQGVLPGADRLSAPADRAEGADASDLADAGGEGAVEGSREEAAELGRLLAERLAAAQEGDAAAVEDQAPAPSDAGTADARDPAESAPGEDVAGEPEPIDAGLSVDELGSGSDMDAARADGLQAERADAEPDEAPRRRPGSDIAAIDVGADVGGAQDVDDSAVRDGADDVDLAVAPVAEAPARRAPAAAALECAPDAAFDLSDWRGDEPYHVGLAERRAALFNELSQPDASAAMALARYQTAWGLGAEARATLRAFEVDLPGAALLADIASAVEGRPPAPDGPLSTPGAREVCRGDHALWRAAALWEADPHAAARAYAASTSGLERIAPSLRRTIGGRVGLALAETGRVDSAKRILALLSRTPEPPTDEMLLLRAEVALIDQRDFAARLDLETLTDGGGPFAPLAAIRLAEEGLINSEPSALVELSLLLSDWALQYRGSDIGRRAATQAARIDADLGAFAEAVAEIEAASRVAGAEEQGAFDTLRERLFLEAIAAVGPEAPSAALVQAVEAADSLPMNEAGDALRIALGERLITAGLAYLAPTVVDAAAAARSAEARRFRERAAAAARRSAPWTGDDMPDETGDTPAEPAIVDPADMDAPDAVAAALAEYLAGSAELSPGAAGALAARSPEHAAVLDGFFEPPTPSVADRSAIADGMELLDALRGEIEFLKELTSDG